MGLDHGCPPTAGLVEEAGDPPIRQFEVKLRRASLERMRSESDFSTTRELGAVATDSTADKSDGSGDHTTIDVEHKSSTVASALPETQGHIELPELTMTGVDDARDQSDDSPNSEFATLGGNKNGKKNKVYIALTDDKEFHEA